MVGVPSSRGCATCRKRRIKCNEQRPSCSQCKRGGRECPGYGRDMKFVDEAPRFTRRRFSQCESAPRLATVEPFYANQHRVQLVAAFVQDLFPLYQGRVQHSFIGGWLWLVPSVLWESQCLDLAAESLALGYFGKKSASKNTIIQSYSAYSKAVQSVLSTLRDPKNRLSTETLCAVLLLVQYERFVSVQGESWLPHAGGVRSLIQLRGPERHRSGIDHAILMASRGYIISEALINEEPCFLDEDDWKNVQVSDTSSPLVPKQYALYHEGLNHFASVPRLLLRARSSMIILDEIEQLRVRSTAFTLRCDLLEWHQTLELASEEPLRIPSITENNIDQPGDYIYRDPISASFAVNYCAYLILVNQVLDLFNGHNLHGDENNALARDIALSASYCSKTGFCGAQAMALTLPIALSAAKVHEKDWIQDCIHTFTDQGHALALRSTILDEI